MNLTQLLDIYFTIFSFLLNCSDTKSHREESLIKWGVTPCPKYSWAFPAATHIIVKLPFLDFKDQSEIMSTHLVYLVVNFVSLSATLDTKKRKLNREKYTEIKIQKMQ